MGGLERGLFERICLIFLLNPISLIYVLFALDGAQLETPAFVFKHIKNSCNKDLIKFRNKICVHIFDAHGNDYRVREINKKN